MAYLWDGFKETPGMEYFGSLRGLREFKITYSPNTIVEGLVKKRHRIEHMSRKEVFLAELDIMIEIVYLEWQIRTLVTSPKGRVSGLWS